jgi:hypothetical protein
VRLSIDNLIEELGRPEYRSTGGRTTDQFRPGTGTGTLKVADVCTTTPQRHSIITQPTSITTLTVSPASAPPSHKNYFTTHSETSVNCKWMLSWFLTKEITCLRQLVAIGAPTHIAWAQFLPKAGDKLTASRTTGTSSHQRLS